MLDRLSSTKLDDGSAHFQASSLQVTVISVPNTATNVIPREARAKVNIRYNDLWSRPKVETFVRDIVERVAVEMSARFDLVFSGTGDVFLTKPGALVDTVAGAVERHTGRRPQLTTGGGTSDARFIHAFCPVVEFGLVNQTIHQVDENVAVEDLETLTRIYEDVLATYFATA
jgi:succinyl-diaminopimelate desuccinylase